MSTFRQRNKPVARELLEKNEFEGRIATVTYENEDATFKVVTFVTSDDKSFKAAGNLYGAGTGEPLRLRGSWREHPKYGWTLNVESYAVIPVKSEEAILAYLGSGLIKGVREKTAKKIVDHFGGKTLEVLDETPELLAEVSGLSRKQARKISDQWEEHRAAREVMIFLKQYGLSNAIATRLLRHYGEQASAILRTNPYRAGLEVSHIGFVKADEIARKMGIAADSPDRVQAAFVHLLDRASAEGHTFLRRDDLLERARQMLELESDYISEQLGDAAARSYIRKEEVGDHGECYFMPSLYACEQGVSRLLPELARQARQLLKGNVDERIQHFEEHYRFSLAPQQHNALRSVASGGVCVITGGPGTGKTTLVRALLHLFKEVHVRFALCSPTGRAAQRLAETTREEAATIHRLLKWNAQTMRFMHHEDNPLPVDLLIVDEASMLDIPLAYSLLRAIPPRASVVFVGDVDQLPSVGPGTFLRDLIQSGVAKTSRLDVIFRQAEKSLIITNSHRINRGEGLKLPGQGNADADFFFVERQTPLDVRDAMEVMAVERVPRKLGCDPVDGVQVLSPMRRGPLGTHELNLKLQELLNPDGEPVSAYGHFRRGDKVMQTSNNYDLDVYNGDVGRIIAHNRETNQVGVKFGGRAVYYPVENLDELELAYAITIHKSQGSEYPAVIVLLHQSHYIMLKRNLLYTAVTRGKKLVVVIGNKRALYKAIRTSPESERLTALEYWLAHKNNSGDLLG